MAIADCDEVIRLKPGDVLEISGEELVVETRESFKTPLFSLVALRLGTGEAPLLLVCDARSHDLSLYRAFPEPPTGGFQFDAGGETYKREKKELVVYTAEVATGAPRTGKAEFALYRGSAGSLALFLDRTGPGPLWWSGKAANLRNLTAYPSS